MCDFFLYDAIKSILSLYVTGIIYDVIVEPPSIGSTTDERGNSKPVRTLFSDTKFFEKFTQR